MRAQTAIRIAEHLEEHLEDLSQNILEELHPKYANTISLFIRPWIQDQISTLRQQSNRFNEWVVKHAGAVRAGGGGLEETFSQIIHIRDCFIELCQGNVTGVSEEETYVVANSLTDRHMKQLTEYYSQMERSRISAERRRERAITEAMDCAFIIVDADSRISLANAHFAEAIGSSPESLRHKKVSRICDEETATEIRRALRQKRSTGTRAFSGRILRPSGKRIAAEFQVQPMFDAQGRRDGIALTLDFGVKQRHALKDYLRYIGEHIVSVMPNPIQICDEQKTIIYSNEAARHVRLSIGDASLPLCCRLTLSKSEAAQSCPCEQVFQSGQTFVAEERYEQLPKSPWYRLVIIPFRDPAGKVLQVACSMRDVSQQRSLEYSLENQLLYQQRTSLASQVAVTVSHQLRNPLGVVIGFAEMLERGLPPEQVPDAVDKILRNGIRCKQIVDDMLEFGQGYPAERVPTEITALMRDIVMPMIPASQLQRIEWILPPETDPVESVPSQLAQVFVNLIDNALKAAIEQVKVEVSQESEWVLVRIVDDGPGVPEDIKERIFEPFVTTRKDEGAVGLGLSLSRSVVRDYGGFIYLDLADANHPEEGASFTTQLPVLRSSARIDSAGQDSTEPATRGERILVVDDETDLLEMLEMVLESRGYSVNTATTAAEAMDLLHKHSFNAVVLDVQLPGDMNGPQLYEYLEAKLPELAQRAIFITADTMNYETRRFLEKVQRPSMEKPFLVFDFVSMVNEVLLPVAP